MKPLWTFVALILLGGCTVKSPDNAWRHYAAASAEQAERYFLEGKPLLAKSAFRRAETHASQSADLGALARIQLQQCALNRAVLLGDDCEEYAKLAPLMHDDTLSSYHALLNGSLKEENIADLPRRYRDFARALAGRNSEKIRKAVTETKPATSMMVAASLAQEHLDDATVESVIDRASYFGYKRAVIAWMEYLAQTTADARKRDLLRQKIEVLTKSR